MSTVLICNHAYCNHWIYGRKNCLYQYCVQEEYRYTSTCTVVVAPVYTSIPPHTIVLGTVLEYKVSQRETM